MFACYPKAVGLILCSVFGISTQGASTTTSGSNVWYNLIIVVLLLLCVWIISVIQKSSRVLSENGYSITDLDFPIFKRMSESGKAVAVVMAILVLVGIYFVVTYTPK